MSDEYLRQSPLHHLALDALAVAAREPAHGVSLRERPFRAFVNLRGQPGDAAFMAAAEAALGVALPTTPNRVAAQGARAALWLAPDEWWITAPDDGPALAQELAAATREVFAAVTDVSEYYTTLEIAGPAARDTLAKGCPLDLHPRVFAPGQCAQSRLSKAPVTLQQMADESGPGGEPLFRLYVRWSFAEYVWRWLADAAGEYGLSVLESAGARA